MENFLKIVSDDFTYRSRATTGRSRLVAAPLRFQAKIFFMCFLCGNLMAKNAFVELWPQPIVARLRYTVKNVKARL